jgi:galactokinase
MTLDQLAARTAAHFQKHYGEPPQWLAAAPGRVNLIGEHTDYNDGFVLPMAIERWTVIAARPAPQLRGTLHSQALRSTALINLAGPVTRAEPAWANYVRGVVAGFQRLGTTVGGFEALMDSTVPLGSGLSSSAALEVASATLLEARTGQELNPVDKALLCQRAEHEFAGVPCGIMDQFTSTLAEADHLLLLDCRSRTVQLVPFTDPSVTVLIVNTNVRHELASGEYARRRAQCETAAKALDVPSLRDATPQQLFAAQDRVDAVVFRRARHVITEIERTLAAAEAIPAADWAQVGRLMYASHASLREDYEVSCPELDCVVELAHSIGPAGGVIGCRMTGGGFGGCAVSLVRTNALEAVMRKLEEGYRARTGIEASMFVSRPAGGARILRAP